MTALGDFSPGDVLTAADLNAIGDWQSYTSSLTNWTASAQDFQYAVVNKIVFVRMFAVVATMGSFPRFTLPPGYLNYGSPHFQRVGLLDAGVTWFDGIVLGHSTTECNLMCIYTGGTYAGYASITATAPHTWAAGDAVDGLFFYKS